MTQDRKLTELVNVAIDWQRTRDEFTKKQARNQRLSIGGLDPTLANKFTEALDAYSNQAIAILGIGARPLMQALVEVVTNSIHQLPED